MISEKNVHDANLSEQTNITNNNDKPRSTTDIENEMSIYELDANTLGEATNGESKSTDPKNYTYSAIDKKVHY